MPSKSEEFNLDAVKLAKKVANHRLNSLDENSDPEKFKDCTLAVKKADEILRGSPKKMKSAKR